MYEIPPSVDHFLRVSSRSMIHFPAVNIDATLSPNVQFTDVLAVSPRNLQMREFGSSNEGMKDDLCLACFPKRKRSNENYEAEQLMDVKRRRTRYSESLNDDEIAKQDFVHKEVENYIRTPDNKEISQRKVFLGSASVHIENVHGPKTLLHRLPELRPNTENKAKDKSLDVSVPDHYSNGRSVARKNPWGSESYSELISGAIKASPNQRASLQQIYDWIVDNVSYFKDKATYPSTKGWKNAIRHTLSIRKRFTRIVNEKSPHASLWTFSKQGYKTNAKC